MIYKWDNIREINVFFEELDLSEIDIINILKSVAYRFAESNKYTLPLSEFIELIEKKYRSNKTRT